MSRLPTSSAGAPRPYYATAHARVPGQVDGPGLHTRSPFVYGLESTVTRRTARGGELPQRRTQRLSALANELETLSPLASKLRLLLLRCSNGATAAQLAKQVQQSRKAVNRALYTELEGKYNVTKTDDTPPVWRVTSVPSPTIQTTSPSSPSTDDSIMVVIDLGHIHGVLEKAIDLQRVVGAQGDADVCILGYADFGAAEVSPEYRCHVRRAPKPGNDMADCMAIYDMTRAIADNRFQSYVIVSKDKIFGQMAEVWRAENPNLTIDICCTWNDLRMYLE